MAEENKTTAEETAEEVKETEAVEDEVTEATPETQAGSEEVEETKEKKLFGKKKKDKKDEKIEELTDRYGDPPKPLLSLMDVALLREEAHQAWLLSIEQKGSKILFTMNPHAKVRVEEIDDFLKQYRNKMKIKPEANPVFVFESEGTLKKELLAKVREIINNIHKLEK